MRIDSSFLSSNKVTLEYNDGDVRTCAVADVSLDLPEKGFVGIMGPSGSGKSSLLYLLSGLKRATRGEVNLKGASYSKMADKELAALRRLRFGFVFQQPFLINYLTAAENIATAAPIADSEIKPHVESLLESVKIGGLGDRMPYHLSGGERQRVCVARAMINRPEIIFADEPTAALDHTNGHIVIDLLAGYRETGLVVVVTHDPEMLADADQIFQMRDGHLES